MKRITDIYRLYHIMNPLGIFVQSFRHKLINYLVRVIVYVIWNARTVSANEKLKFIRKNVLQVGLPHIGNIFSIWLEFFVYFFFLLIVVNGVRGAKSYEEMFSNSEVLTCSAFAIKHFKDTFFMMIGSTLNLNLNSRVRLCNMIFQWTTLMKLSNLNGI